METRSKSKAKNLSCESKIKHPKSWNQHTHYGQCGQSCPCCRAFIEEVPFGVCNICWINLGKEQSKVSC